MIIDKRDETYALTDFVDGKGQGRSDSFRKGVLVGSTELKNGLPNGYKITYDMTGKHVMWKMQMVNGKRHGHTWWADKGDTYFFKGREVSKEEFERRTEND
jgi:antitoxin component YwqK of YwqJK toxin-antitoxin module